MVSRTLTNPIKRFKGARPMSGAIPETILKPATVAASAEMAKDIKVNKDGSTDVAPDMYEKTLPGADLDMSTVKKVQNHNKNTMAAFAHSVAEAGLKQMEKDKKLETVHAEVKFGNDTVVVQVDRSRNFPNPKEGGTVQRFGVVSANYKVSGGGEFKRVKEVIGNKAKSMLGE